MVSDCVLQGQNRWGKKHFLTVNEAERLSYVPLVDHRDGLGPDDAKRGRQKRFFLKTAHLKSGGFWEVSQSGLLKFRI